MELLPGLVLSRQLVLDLVDAGERGHQIALAHHNDPGSSGFTFGGDRYHRTCELAREPLEQDGWTVRTVGAGYRARKDKVELWFATARTADIAAPSSFDNRSDTRLEAGVVNRSLRPQLDGLEEEDPSTEQVAHVVYSGNSSDGLVAVHVGRLVPSTEASVAWLDVRRVDTDEYLPLDETDATTSTSVRPAYDEQPEPSIDLLPTTPEERDDSDEAAAES